MDDAGLAVRAWQRYGVIMLRAPEGAAASAAEADATADKIAERARDLMGVAKVCRAVRVAKEPGAAIETAVALMAGKTGSFAVRARRRDKRFPLTSSQLAVLVGREIQKAHGLPVDLSHPETEVFIEVDQREVFVFTSGLPVLGICYGLQLLTQELGGKVEPFHKKEFGHAQLTVGSLIRRLRLEHARQRLIDPRDDHLSVTDIAYACGFADLPTFSHGFKQTYHESPSSYRRRTNARHGLP